MNIEDKILQVPLEEIIPNRFQPRLTFDEKELNELAQSIKEHGIIQPLVLRKCGDKYEIIAGERRYKASTIAGLKTVPAVISNIDDNQSAEVALVENIQRKNLTSIEEAKSYKNILDRGYMTQEGLAEKLGISQSTIANKLRLLNLAEEVQDALLNEQISERHARALLSLDTNEDQVKWLNKILTERLTVRQLDLEIKKLKSNGKVEEEEIPIVNNLTPDINDIKNNALDINPVQGLHDIEKMLTPSTPGERIFDLSGPIDTLDIDEEDTTGGVTIEENVKPQNKFFNFLEDEVANMNESTSIDDISNNVSFNIEQEIEPNLSESVVTPSIEETIINVPYDNNIGNDNNIINDFQTQSVIDTTLNNDNNNITNFNEINNSFVELNNSINPINEENNSIVSISEITNPSVLETDNSIELIQDKPIENILDPMNLVDTIEPGYNEKIKEENGTDLKTAINILRKTKEDLEARGFIVNLDEADLGLNYSITFNIIKDEETK